MMVRPTDQDRLLENDPLGYLAIPGPYFSWLGGLQWSDDAEAVEYRDDQVGESRTFAMLGEVVLFLEGLSAGGPAPCFGQVLHFLDLLGTGRRTEIGDDGPAGRQPSELRRLFRDCGRPFRNAGALAVHLGVSRPVGGRPIAIGELCRMVAAVRDRSDRLGRALALATADVPPLSPLIFSARVLKGLAVMTPEEIHHWLKSGRPPAISGRELAELDRPRSLADVLAAVEQRPRMAAASVLAGRLLGALAVPPRRLASAELPVGGYADVSNRGHPEQLLLSQFALDSTELLRRFAEKELLYFRREEPRAPTSEELLVVIDQGVRTWGGVRSVLAAATLAMGRLADRRGIRFRAITTGEPGEIADPLELGDQAFGERLESTDLSPNPAQPLEYLAATLVDAPPTPRDVVLLTHARGLREPAVLAASAGLPTGTRLFAVGVDDRGEVGLAELRQGGASPISRCRVPMPTEPEPAESPIESLPVEYRYRPWTGDVESVPFPFRLGMARRPAIPPLDLDPAGKWLFVAGYAGVVHAWAVDGGRDEILPRGSFGGRVVSDLVSLVGVTGGVLSIGRLEGEWVATHHDLSERTVQVYPLGLITGMERIAACYLRRFHCVLVRGIGAGILGLDLGQSPAERAESLRHHGARGLGLGTTPRCQVVLGMAAKLSASRDHHPGDPREDLAPDKYGSWPILNEDWFALAGSGVVDRSLVSFDHKQGIVTLNMADGRTESWTSLADGKPAMVGCHLGRAVAAGPVVAISTISPGQTDAREACRILLFGPLGKPIREISRLANGSPLAISQDGRRIAFAYSNHQIVAEEVAGEGRTQLVTRETPRIHSRIRVMLDRDRLAISIAGAPPGSFLEQPHRVISWSSGVLEWSRSLAEDRELASEAMTPLGEVSRSGLPPTDRRFVARGGIGGLQVQVDYLGQIIVHDFYEDLVAVFFLFRDDFAAWMPDGTRLGDPDLIGGPPTPDAARKIGQAMRTAARSDQPRTITP